MASRPGAAFDSSPKMPALDGWPSWMYERAVGAAAQELDAVEAADDVRVQREEVLDVAAVARQIAQLLLVEPAGDRLALERDVVLPLGRDRDDVLEPADLEVEVRARRPRRRAGRTPVRCTFLKPLRVAVTV